MSGYSGTPLPKKLGIKAESKVVLISAPEGFDETLGPLPEDVRLMTRLGRNADVIIFFATSTAALTKRLDRLIEGLAVAGGLWIAWPKKASGVNTDVTEDVLRTVILPTGLVDNKVCAIDETWSGLRFVRRRENR